jgi:hypothetical protein
VAPRGPNGRFPHGGARPLSGEPRPIFGFPRGCPNCPECPPRAIRPNPHPGGPRRAPIYANLTNPNICELDEPEDTTNRRTRIRSVDPSSTRLESSHDDSQHTASACSRQHGHHHQPTAQCDQHSESGPSNHALHKRDTSTDHGPTPDAATCQQPTATHDASTSVADPEGDGESSDYCPSSECHTRCKDTFDSRPRCLGMLLANRKRRCIPNGRGVSDD